MIEPWVIELNNHISLFGEGDDVEEYVPYVVAKQMIAEREAKIAELYKQLSIYDLYRFFYTPYNPCANGHLFQWSSNGTGETNPPVGTKCLCGETVYKKPE